MRSNLQNDGPSSGTGRRRPFRESSGSTKTNSAQNINDENAPPHMPTHVQPPALPPPSKRKQHHYTRYLKRSRGAPLNVQDTARACQEQGAAASENIVVQNAVHRGFGRKGPTVASSTRAHAQQTPTLSPRLSRRRNKAWEGVEIAASDSRRDAQEGRIPLHVSQDVREKLRHWRRLYAKPIAPYPGGRTSVPTTATTSSPFTAAPRPEDVTLERFFCRPTYADPSRWRCMACLAANGPGLSCQTRHRCCWVCGSARPRAEIGGVSTAEREPASRRGGRAPSSSLSSCPTLKDKKACSSGRGGRVGEQRGESGVARCGWSGSTASTATTTVNTSSGERSPPDPEGTSDERYFLLTGRIKARYGPKDKIVSDDGGLPQREMTPWRSSKAGVGTEQQQERLGLAHGRSLASGTSLSSATSGATTSVSGEIFYGHGANESDAIPGRRSATRGGSTRKKDGPRSGAGRLKEPCSDGAEVKRKGDALRKYGGGTRASRVPPVPLGGRGNVGGRCLVACSSFANRRKPMSPQGEQGLGGGRVSRKVERTTGETVSTTLDSGFLEEQAGVMEGGVADTAMSNRCEKEGDDDEEEEEERWRRRRRRVDLAGKLKQLSREELIALLVASGRSPEQSKRDTRSTRNGQRVLFDDGAVSTQSHASSRCSVADDHDRVPNFRRRRARGVVTDGRYSRGGGERNVGGHEITAPILKKCVGSGPRRDDYTIVAHSGKDQACWEEDGVWWFHPV